MFSADIFLTGASESGRLAKLLRALIDRPTACGALVLACLACATSCSARQELTIADPYEIHNRELFKSVRKTDEVFVRPASAFYHKSVNDYVQKGIRNFINNIEGGNIIINDLLQVRIHRFFHDSARLLINSTAGLLGLIDVASYLDLEREENDFGKTLAFWGWRKSSYVIVPIFGTKTVRGLYGSAIEYIFLHPIRFLNFNYPERLIYELLRGANKRIDLFAIDGIIDDPSIIDDYAFVRQYYRQSRIIFIQRQGKVAESKVIWSDEDFDLLD